MDTKIEERAIVLRTAAVRESDLIVTLLTHSHGKVAAVARGARKSKRRFPGGLDLFDFGVFSLQRLKSHDHLFQLDSLERAEAWLGLRSDLASLSYAALALELADVFASEEDPTSSALFAPLIKTLQHLNDPERKQARRAELCRYCLSVLTLSGIDPLASHGDFQQEQNAVLTTLLTNGNEDGALDLRAALKALLDYTERAIGKRLLTRIQVASLAQAAKREAR